MWSDGATKKRWRRRVVSGALVVLGLTAVSLPNGWAQMRYSGGLVADRSPPPPDTLRDAAPRSSPSEAALPRTHSPDGDDYYPSFTAPTALARSESPAQGASRSLSAFGVSMAALPWNQPDYEGYDLASTASPSGQRKYALAAAALARENPADEGGRALLVVRLPVSAMLWVEGRQIALQGSTSYFRSPPLQPGKKYDYAVRAAWVEDGRWVSRTREVTVEAGLAQAVYLRPTSELLVRDKLAAQIETALAKLSPEDRAAARRQRTCVVRKEVRLGECGVPIKVTLKGKSVFVCCKECAKKLRDSSSVASAGSQAPRPGEASPPR